MAVCDKTYQILTNSSGPYSQEIIPVPPYADIPLESASQFSCKTKAVRHPRETKGVDYQVTSVGDETTCCSPGECG